jgi:hypothetical protein
MYDDTCKFLAEHFSADFASWLLGETVTLTEIQPSELSLDPIRADAMILLQSEDSILHLEFQTIPKENIPFRMLDYRVRGNRRYKSKSMRQVVIYLKPTTSELAYQTSYDLERTHHEFDVVRLWEQPASLFLQWTLALRRIGAERKSSRDVAPSYSACRADRGTNNTSKSDGSLSDPSWVKIRRGRNLPLSAEGHYARICNLPIHSA